ncbi:putative multidrug ABC transporter ATP-binding protein YbhF [Anaerolineae bacterium]|nr:putative multidrug ABC transporter ATP-binding protein YbhF [Anaerolineae bacterium]
MTAAIQVEGLVKHYGQIHALRGLNLTVQEGEIFGLLGANGAGKTTLIKSLIGLTRPDQGRALVLGLDPQRHKNAVRRQIGYMPQSPVLYEDLSARENLVFLGKAHAIPDLKARIEETLAFIQLEGRADDPVYGFSGGMKQRLSLACALLHHPRMLFLDEPTTGVDPKLREAFWNTFRRMAQEGTTILLSTHQMDEALYCDRLAVMRDGQVLTSDTPKSLMARGSTVVKVWRGGEAHTARFRNYAAALPQLLRQHHLDPQIERIEVEHDNLEAVVLELINARFETPQPEPDFSPEVTHVG